ncbi:MAG: transcriptional repressor [Coriobacteriia bacterium]|nr:transcriptional repressor [Coriobacteriia bacterium]
MTEQRKQIAATATRMTGAFSVDELAAACRREHCDAGVATVYRAVNAMVASGWLERVGERGGSVLYARCEAGDHHHHHIVCDGCGRTEIAECPVTIAPGAHDVGGFVVTRHDVTLYGLCPTCATDAGPGH